MNNKCIVIGLLCMGVAISVQITLGNKIWDAIKHPWRTAKDIKDSLKETVETSKDLINQMQASIPKIANNIKDIKVEVGGVRRTSRRKDKISRGFDIIPNIMNVAANLGDIAGKLSVLMSTISTDIIARFNESVAQKGVNSSQKLQNLSKDIAYLKDRINVDLVALLKKELGLLEYEATKIATPDIIKTGTVEIMP